MIGFLDSEHHEEYIYFLKCFYLGIFLESSVKTLEYFIHINEHVMVTKLMYKT